MLVLHLFSFIACVLCVILSQFVDLLLVSASGSGAQYCDHSVCLCVCVSKGKLLELLTPKLVEIWSMVGPRRAPTLASKGEG